MTGFGAAEGETARGTLRIEIRTVNHRFFNFSPKLPVELLPHEADLRERLRRDLERGHVTVHARWVGDDSAEGRIGVDVDRARQVVAGLRELQVALGLGGAIDLGLVARQPEVITRSVAPTATLEWQDVEPVLDRAMAACLEMRAREGAALAEDLAARLSSLATSAAEVAELAPGRLVRERDRLRANVQELLDGQSMDETRLAQEIALTADRLDITEELVRLRTHIAACRDALASDGPMGKQLGFLAQEMGREVNTIGSKANDAEIAQRVIAMKGELEKIREQVENLE